MNGNIKTDAKDGKTDSKAKKEKRAKEKSKNKEKDSNTNTSYERTPEWATEIVSDIFEITLHIIVESVALLVEGIILGQTTN